MTFTAFSNKNNSWLTIYAVIVLMISSSSQTTTVPGSTVVPSTTPQYTIQSTTIIPPQTFSQYTTQPSAVITTLSASQPTKPTAFTTTQNVPHSTTQPAAVTTTQTLSKSITQPTTATRTQTVAQNTTQPAAVTTTKTVPYSTKELTTVPTTQIVPLSTTKPAAVTTTQTVPQSTTKVPTTTTTQTVPYSSNEPTTVTTTQTVPQSTTHPATASTTKSVPQSTNKLTTVTTTEIIPHSTTQPTAVTTEQTVLHSTTKPATAATTQAVPQSTNQPATITTTKFVPQYPNEPTTVTTTQTVSQSTTQPTTVTTPEIVPHSTTQPAGATTTQTVQHSTIQPATASTRQTVSQSTTLPATITTTQAVPDYTNEPIAVTATEIFPHSTTHPAVVTTTQIVSQCTTQSVGLSTTQTVPQSTNQPGTTTTTKSVPQSTTQPANFTTTHTASQFTHPVAVTTIQTVPYSNTQPATVTTTQTVPHSTIQPATVTTTQTVPHSSTQPATVTTTQTVTKLTTQLTAVPKQTDSKSSDITATSTTALTSTTSVNEITSSLWGRRISTQITPATAVATDPPSQTASPIKTASSALRITSTSGTMSKTQDKTLPSKVATSAIPLTNTWTVTAQGSCSLLQDWLKMSSVYSVPEDVPIGSTIARLPSEVCIVNGSQGAIEIDPQSGRIYVQTDVHQDQTTQYDYNVSFCGCPGEWHSVTVSVDANLPPKFPQRKYSLDIIEGSGQDTVVGSFPADDRDTCAEELTYELHPSSVRNHLIIGPLAVVSIRRKMYHDQLVDAGIIAHQSDRSFTFQISASDGTQNTSTTVLATVLSALKTLVNYTEITVYIAESLPPDTFVANVHEVLGKTPDTQMCITQHSRQDVFKVDQFSGNITTKVTFDRESRSSYALILEVDPIGCVEAKMGLEVVVIIEDVNDNRPEFSPVAYSCHVPEASDTLHGLIVAVSDEDSEENALVELSIDDALQNVLLPRKVDGSTSFNAFTVDVLQPIELDYEMTSTLHVNLTARDLGIPPMSTTAELTIHLLDVNDNPPVFSNSSYFIITSLSSPRTLPVLTVSASDKDTFANAEISYYILSGSYGKVSLTKNTGEVRLTFDVQFPENITFQVMAKDNGLPSRSAVADVTVVVMDGMTQNATKLSFTHAFYNATVSELSLQALTVAANDPINLGIGEIEYIMGQQLYGSFSKLVLNSTTGEIRFSSPVDYEIVEQRFFLFDVLAQTPDHSAFASATVLIEIEDNNDVLPLFTEDTYQVTLGLLDPRGTPVLYVLATDPDGTPIQYSLGQELDARLFNIDSDTGLITLIDKTSVSQFNDSLKDSLSFSVLATDGVNTATSSVTVNFSNIPAPIVFQRNISISERTAAGAVIDMTETEVVVQQIYGPTHVFQVDQGLLVLRRALDRENESTYAALVTSHYSGSRNISLVTINILDENDNPPRCDRPYYQLIIPGGKTGGERSPLIGVSDADLPPYNTWSASLSDYRSIFRFTRESIQLIADRGTLNLSTYEFHIDLVDDNDSQLSSTCWLHVEVMGVNSIIFSNLPQRLSLSEDLPVGAVVLTVKAELRDGKTSGQFSYRLSSRTADAYLSVDEISGEVMVNKTLDYEMDRDFVIIVQAFQFELALTASATISVLVEDYNDNMPVFDQTEYYKEITNNPKLGDVMITVTATDDDEGPAGDVTYAIEGCGEAFFAINNRTGDITLAKPFELVYYPNISLVVTATDGGKYRRVSRALVLFTVPSFNPTAPKFIDFYPNISVREEVQTGVIFTVRAFDAEDNNLLFDLPESPYSEYFDIGELNGEIRVKKPLDREQIARDFYQSRSPASRGRRQTEVIRFCRQEEAEVIPLIVKVFDHGIPQRSARICLRIIILDSNDHKPVFNKTEVTIVFKETFEKDVGRTLPLTAVDEDKGDFGEVFYAITSRTSYFKIEKREDGPTIVALRDCEDCKQTRDYQFQQVTVYAYNKGDVIEESGFEDQLLTVNIRLSCGDRCGLSTVEIILIPLCSLLALAVILLIVLFVRQYKRHKLYTEGTDRRNLEKLRDAQRTHFQPRDETYNQPDVEESGFPITRVSRDGYLTPRIGDSGQTNRLYVDGLRSDEGYRSQESDRDYFFQPEASHGVPRMENFNSISGDMREYFSPLSSSGYSNRVALKNGD
ncbi:protocadherin Fat 4-like isoform X2 [Liolophura sinensis]|uniref:protocadherin Fat 4-like isoform X2 n=1 Tax=Liolophura sinensis TaxID=3198878 RepID=UPI00315865D1